MGVLQVLAAKELNIFVSRARVFKSVWWFVCWLLLFEVFFLSFLSNFC